MSNSFQKDILLKEAVFQLVKVCALMAGMVFMNLFFTEELQDLL